MNYKGVWESIGRFFYTTNFSLLVSALIVWDTSLLDLIPGIIHIELSSILVLFGVLLLLAYYIIDWLDANLVSSIDKEVEIKDIVVWLLSPISLSLILTILLKKKVFDSFTSWLYFGFNFYTIFNTLILFKRKKYIDYEVRNQLYGNEEKKQAYDKVISVHILEKLLGAVYIILFLAANVNLIIEIKERKPLLNECELLLNERKPLLNECELLLNECEHMILIVFVLIILLNFALKWYRYKNVNLLYYNINNNKTNKEIRKKEENNKDKEEK